MTYCTSDQRIIRFFGRTQEAWLQDRVMRLNQIVRLGLSAFAGSGTSERGAAIAIIAFATFSALLWALIRIPGAGGPDESAHLDLIERIREVGGLPLFHGFDRSQFTWTPGRVINAYELTPNVSALALAGVASMLRLNDPVATLVLSRIFAVGLFPFTLLFGYLTLRILFPDRPVERLYGLTALATLPQFMLVHSYVTNDTATIAFATLATYVAVRGWAHGFRPRDSILLGVALGLVGLHKANGLIVLPLTVWLVVWRLRREPGDLVRTLSIVAATAFAIAGWWYVRMLVIYGDPFGTEATRAAAEAVGTAVPTPRDQGLSPWDYAWSSGWVEGTFRSFWAGYGVRRMTVPDAAYFVFLVMLVLGAAGLISATWRARERVTGTGSVWIAFALAVAGLWLLNLWTSWTLDGVAMHGRYTYPVIVPFVALLTVGLGRVFSITRCSSLIMASMIPLMVVGNLAYSVFVVMPDVVALRVWSY